MIINEVLKADKSGYKALLSMLEGSLDKEQYFCPTDGKVTKAKGFFDKDSRLITGYAPLVLDDDEAYFMLFEALKGKTEALNRVNPSERDIIVAKTIQEVVFGYYGVGRPDDFGRTMLYRQADAQDRQVSMKEFKDSRRAMCLERASLAHNCFLLLGYDSTIVASDTYLNGEKNLHSYGIVTLGEEEYVYDLVCSKVLEGDMPSPIIAKVEDGLENITFTSQRGRENTITYKYAPVQTSVEPESLIVK